jgi:hypothetical protein
VSTLCGLIQRWSSDGEIQLSAINALNAIIEENAQASAKAVSAGAVQLVRTAINAHPRNPEIQRSGTRALQHLSTSASAAIPTTSLVTAVGGVDEEETSSRKGLAAALMEKRAADAVAKPNIVSTTMNWLFSGRQRGSASNRQGNNSEPPGARHHSQRSAAPAPLAPTTPATSVPHLDLAGQTSAASARKVPLADGWHAGAHAAANSAGVSSSAAAGRRATSRPAPMVSTAAHDDGMSPREESPLTPSVVRSLHRRDAQESGHDVGQQIASSPRNARQH